MTTWLPALVGAVLGLIPSVAFTRRRRAFRALDGEMRLLKDLKNAEAPESVVTEIEAAMEANAKTYRRQVDEQHSWGIPMWRAVLAYLLSVVLLALAFILDRYRKGVADFLEQPPSQMDAFVLVSRIGAVVLLLISGFRLVTLTYRTTPWAIALVARVRSLLSRGERTAQDESAAAGDGVH